MYGNATKNEWRRDVWAGLDQLLKLTDPEREGYVLALAGNRFLDRKEAIRLGFRKSRVIGVDSDDGVVAHNTKHGRVVIQRELSDVMKGWDDGRPVSVLIADFTCNGGAKPVQETIWSWAHLEAFKNCLLVLNVSVGRETRQFLQYLREAEHLEDKLADLNRAQMAVEYRICEEIGWPDGCLSDPGLDTSNELVVGALRYQAHKMNMDSCIVAPMWSDHWNDKERVSGVELLEDKSIRRHIGAKLAWVTMREIA